VHHRIKNNMSSIHSLLSLQARMSGEPTVTDALQDAGRRIQSMQSLYEQLYRSDLSGMLSAEAYLSPLVRTIVYTFPNAAAISITDSIEPITLNASVLQPLGIIVTELITNSMKYAFHGRTSGSIAVTLEREMKELILTVRDDGPGIPESQRTQETSGFGLKLVRLLAEQLGGTIHIRSDEGTSFTLTFSIPGAE
jgi:two-component sensor histidine kinase